MRVIEDTEILEQCKLRFRWGFHIAIALIVAGCASLLSAVFAAEPLLTVHSGVVDAVTSVRNHGADGSDTEDDSAAFQAAIDAAGSGPVYVPPGKYYVSGQLTIRNPGVTLFGFGGPHAKVRPVEIVYSGPPGTTLFLLAGDVTAGFTLRGMFLTGDFPKDTTKADCLTIEGGDEFTWNFTLDRVGIYRFRRGLLLQKTGKMLWLGDVLVEGCNITQCDQAIVCLGSKISNLDILNSTIRQNRGTTGSSRAPIMDLRGRRMRISGCLLEGQRWPINVYDGMTVVVEHCYFEGNQPGAGPPDPLLSCNRVKGLRFVNNHQRLLAAEKYVELVRLSECIDLVVERPAICTGKWEMP